MNITKTAPWIILGLAVFALPGCTGAQPPGEEGEAAAGEVGEDGEDVAGVWRPPPPGAAGSARSNDWDPSNTRPRGFEDMPEPSKRERTAGWSGGRGERYVDLEAKNMRLEDEVLRLGDEVSRLRTERNQLEDERDRLLTDLDNARRATNRPAAPPARSGGGYGATPGYARSGYQPRPTRPTPRPAFDPPIALPPGSRINARVIGIEPAMGAVFLDVGLKDGIRPGATFTVYRDSTYVAKVIVERPMSDFSGARVEFVAEGLSIAKGDAAAWRVD